MVLWAAAAAAEGVSPRGPAPCADNLKSPIPNFCVVTPGVLWRGARPGTDGAAWLIKQGVRTVVNLELLLEDRAAFEAAPVASEGHYEAGYFRLRDWEPLPLLAPAVVDDHVAHFLAIVSGQPKPVYVHCRSGQNRTGLMVAAYRVVMEGMPAEEAIAEMGRYKGLWFEADSAYIKTLTPAHREAIRAKIAAWIPQLQPASRIVCADGTCTVSEP